MKEKKATEEWVHLSDLPPLDEEENSLASVDWIPLDLYNKISLKEEKKTESLLMSWMPLEFYLKRRKLPQG